MEHRTRPHPAAARRLSRSSDGKLIAGVANGVGRHYGIEPNLVRLAFVVLALGRRRGRRAVPRGLVVAPRRRRACVAASGRGARPPRCREARGSGQCGARRAAARTDDRPAPAERGGVAGRVGGDGHRADRRAQRQADRRADRGSDRERARSRRGIAAPRAQRQVGRPGRSSASRSWSAGWRRSSRRKARSRRSGRGSWPWWW